jgi:hypothetical protein
MKGRPGGFVRLPKNWPQNKSKNMANEYLTKNFSPKLPGRIRKAYESKN